MQLPLTVTFHGMSRSDWIEDDIRKRAAKLETYCPDIMSCRVVVAIPHRHHEAGNRFSLRIDLTVPGDEIAVNRESNLHASRKDLGEEEWVKHFDVEGMRKDLRLVIREAFDVARRRLQDYARKRRLAVKTHEEMPHGRVITWIPEEHCGAIEAPDGHEIYFHENSVLASGVKRLRVGAEVTFVEERGEKGPQASTVQVTRARPERASA
jgi:cold shock CspA family protein/ribosome-associated translation inhibitor RaiA